MTAVGVAAVILSFLLGRISMSWQIGRSFILFPKRGGVKFRNVQATEGVLRISHSRK
jgi:hypothetical protein